MQFQLPADAENQTHVTVHALLAGTFWIPYNLVFQDCIHEPIEVGCQVPFNAFMITHPTYGRALFDLGLRKHGKGWPPVISPTLTLEEFRVHCDEDTVDVLRKGGVDPGEINKVIYSHLHWDHTGDPTPFTNADIVLGSESKIILEDTYPSNPNSSILALPANMKTEFIDFADPNVHKRVSPFGPYDRAVDYYGDGSLYLVDSPGHIPGHMAVAARIAPNSFVFLAADTCHNRLCYSPGERLVSQACHSDIEAARKTVRCLVKLNKEYDNAVIVLSHERERVQEMSFFPTSDLRHWVVGEIEKRRKAT